MLKEQAARWYLNGYNCAECIIHAANEQWQLGMSEADMRMVSGFGGRHAVRRCLRRLVRVDLRHLQDDGQGQSA